MPSTPEIELPTLIFENCPISIVKGSFYTITARGEEEGIAYKGHKIKIAELLDHYKDGPNQSVSPGMHLIGESSPHDRYGIGLCSETELVGWHNLNGNVPENCGYWVDQRNFINGCFKKVETNSKYYVKDTFVFRKKDLKGMCCKPIINIGHDHIFVEFVLDIGGSSCDGKGNNGHCLILPQSILTENANDVKVRNEDIVEYFKEMSEI